ncbi:MAG TPA: GNAT family protein [Iamia sp.]
MNPSTPLPLDAFVRHLEGHLGLNGRIAPQASFTHDLMFDSVQRMECVLAVADLGVELADVEAGSVDTAEELHRAYARRAGTTPAPAAPTAPAALVDEAGLRIPPLVGRYTVLRAVRESDLRFLYDVSTAGENSVRWRYRGAVPTMEQFASQLWQGTLAQFVVGLRSTGEDIGHVILYSADLHNAHASLGAVFTSEVVGTGFPVEAVRLFRDYAFATWPLRKLYLEVPAYNLQQFASGIGRDLVVEGHMRGHLYYGGRYWDQHLFAMYPEGGPVEEGR